jgi:hypothetical protein
MRTLRFATAAWLMGTALAMAQEPSAPINRGDVHFVIGWQNLHKAQPIEQSYSNDWLNGIFYGGAGAGWYWTDHLKTQVDIGGGTRTRQYRYEYTVVNGQSRSTSSQLNLQQQNVAIAQQYQFFRNQWFHPHVAAGVDIARETTTEVYQPVLVYDSTGRITTTITPGRTEGPEHRFIARPFLEGGFKGYVTRRAFFTGDTRLMVRKGIDEVLFRIGFGVDF